MSGRFLFAHGYDYHAPGEAGDSQGVVSAETGLTHGVPLRQTRTTTSVPVSIKLPSNDITACSTPSISASPEGRKGEVVIPVLPIRTCGTSL